MIVNYNTEVKRWTFNPQNPKEMGAATKYRKRKKIKKIGYSPAEMADILLDLEKIYSAAPKVKKKTPKKAPKKTTKRKKTSTKKTTPKNQAPPSTGTTDSTAHTEGEALRLIDL